ncbi:DUF4375 domain-containing protein [uncultured Massilia sp.]|uniref:DMP19 family protein n=1 Tax=uncultured Massilia sp. TaxID=169973 RepID=UPI002583E476|nr:DUF4375 domain-containing protein [uncultured Massilia sp.]
MIQSFFDKAIDYSQTFLREFDGNAARLPEPMRTVVIVTAAQGIIDNGGLEYFFGNDFPHNPPYSMFVEAFRQIGADTVAACIEDAADMFPFPDPHLHEAQRRLWMDSIRDNETHDFALLSNKACGDEVPYEKLEEFVGRNRAAFTGMNLSTGRDTENDPTSL